MKIIAYCLLLGISSGMAHASLELFVAPGNTNTVLNVARGSPSTSEVVAVLGQPSRVDWPLHLPLKQVSPTLLVLYYPEHGVIFRFAANQIDECFSVYDILIILREIEWAGIHFNASSLIARTANETISFDRLPDIERRDTLEVERRGEAVFWNTAFLLFGNDFEKRYGIPLAETITGSPPWNFKRSVFVFPKEAAPGERWRAEFVLDDESKPIALRLLPDVASSERGKAGLQIDVDVQIGDMNVVP